MSGHNKVQQPQDVTIMLQNGLSPEQIIQVHLEAGCDLSEVVRLILRAGAEPENFNDGFLSTTPDNEIPPTISYCNEQPKYELLDVISGRAKADWQRDNPRFPNTWQSNNENNRPMVKYPEDEPKFVLILQKLLTTEGKEYMIDGTAFDRQHLTNYLDGCMKMQYSYEQAIAELFLEAE